MTYKNWNIEGITGYKPITTFYMDFSIVEPFGSKAVKEIYKLVFDEWKSNYQYLTELVAVLNWKILEHYGRNDKLAKLYDELWSETDEFARTNLTGNELDYFLIID